MHKILPWPLWSEKKKTEVRDLSYCAGLDRSRKAILHFSGRIHHHTPSAHMRKAEMRQKT